MVGGIKIKQRVKGMKNIGVSENGCGRGICVTKEK